MSIKLAVATLCFLALLVPLAGAAETTEPFSVYTDQQDYIVGQPVNVYVKANLIDPSQTITVTDVIVYDPTNSSVADWHVSIVLKSTEEAVQVGTFIAMSEGAYSVSANAAITTPSSGTTGVSAQGARWLWILMSRWRFWCRFWRPNVVPEYPFGTIAAMGAMIGVTGLYVARKKHKI
jgi:hypothetical protein